MGDNCQITNGECMLSIQYKIDLSIKLSEAKCEMDKKDQLIKELVEANKNLSQIILDNQE